MPDLRVTFVLLAALALPAYADGVEHYTLDPVHTRVMFAVEHAGFSKALGTVSGSAGHLQFDPDDWRSARLEVEVPLDRLDLGDAKWNSATRASNLLDTARHPVAHFVSTQVEPVDREHAKVCGELTLRGVTRPQCLDVTLNAIKRHPLPPFRRTAGFSATAQLSRSAYGIDAWRSVIGDTIELRIEAEAVRTRGEPEVDANEASPPPSSTSPKPVP
ncbi:MAG: FIG01112334: hypothetical protein [uncultured Lysobacter sp.]|uniref:Lipid/polyisoprenoid-binding YceI-like domain-containing protein n=1 Tax=uncultured Lysobacter sp. TaxID=271060 RepID=A0A6J4MB94_9GAMM|nr:MAG: FIG01112334: hypothetical protein [uncultured Lysobacter sp.]